MMTAAADILENRHDKSIMSEETNALLALKHAWNGVVETSEKVRELAPAVQALDESTPIASLDLATYHRLTLAQANAAEALRGLIEEIGRKSGVLPGPPTA
jgi:hypothetical protein